MDATPDTGQLLERFRNGDESVLNELTALLYDQLHGIASRHLRGERASHTLQTTALVHETYLKLIGDAQRTFVDREHFLAIASRVMRQVLVDYARARAAKKRSPDAKPDRIARIEVQESLGGQLIELLDLDSALDALAREDQSLARLMELRYFGGLTAEEAANVLGQSVHAVRHDLRLAQAWLRRNLGLEKR